jgi:hypothetical protein
MNVFVCFLGGLVVVVLRFEFSKARQVLDRCFTT